MWKSQTCDPPLSDKSQTWSIFNCWIDLAFSSNVLSEALCSWRSALDGSVQWVSQLIVPGTSAESVHTGSALEWRRNGVARYLVVGARRAVVVWPSSSHRSTPQRSGFTFPRSFRLTRGSDIQRIRAKGKRVRTEHLEVRFLASPLRHPRVGFVVPLFGHSAVERNRLKRQLREIVRTELLETLPAADVVIRVQPNAYGAPFAALTHELRVSADGARRQIEWVYALFANCRCSLLSGRAFAITAIILPLFSHLLGVCDRGTRTTRCSSWNLANYPTNRSMSPLSCWRLRSSSVIVRRRNG